MRTVFESATLKLTAWYLFIILLICLLFSFIIYQTSSREFSMRLQNQASAVRQVPAFRSASTQLQSILDQQLREGRRNLKLNLLYTNIAILLVGGAGSYLLARRTLQPIEESNEAQSRFTADASHELRTPLATMQAEIEVALRDSKISKSDLIDLLKSNLEEVAKLQGISNALLELSQLQTRDIEMEEIDLSQIVQEAQKRLRQSADDKQITIVQNLKPITLEGNAVILLELFTILLDNAIKYSYHGGTVQVTTFRRSGMAVVKVTDHGSGISQNDLPYIFDRFYRGDASRSKTLTSGYGLGLSLADEIVDTHNGSIAATSAKAGTVFTVRLPA